MELTQKDMAVVNALVTHFYDVVPHKFSTYCALTARIVQSVLKHHGIHGKLIPCQVWLVTEKQNYIVGFLGDPGPGKWDGHVICRAKNFIVDAALKHFEVDFGMGVPGIIAAHCFEVPTQVISRRDLNASSSLWWHYPPTEPHINLSVPEQPEEIITRYADELIRFLALPPVSLHAAADQAIGGAAKNSPSD